MTVTGAQHEQRLRNVNTIAATRRSQLFCKRGHLLVGANVYRAGSRRQCRRCTLDRGFYAYHELAAPQDEATTLADPYEVLLREVLDRNVSLDDARSMLRELDEVLL